MGIVITSLLTADEQMLIKRCEELFSRAEKGVPAMTQFLNLRERYIIENRLSSFFTAELSDPLCFFYGGFPDAQRTLLVCMPAYFRYSMADGQSAAEACRDELRGTVVPLRIKTSGYVRLAHRDFLGSLVGLGIDRCVLGDIVTDDEGAIVFVLPSVAEVIKNELVYIGRDKVKVTDISLPEDFNYIPEFEKISGTVASARLDGVLSELCRTSRENAKLLIKQGLCEHNHFTASEPDAGVEAGDIISVRKTSGVRGGKFIVDSIDERSAKGRIRLSARRFI